ncbi:MAG: M20/M25/M40 family metallo-hydrolase, partial [Pseudomonadales bacterium]
MRPRFEPALPLPDMPRLQGELDALASLSSTPPPGVTRILFTETDLAGRDFVRALMRDAGLTVIEDAAGNIVGRWLGTDGDRGRVGTGSHCDAIPHAGRYDGTVGVLGGIAAVRLLRAHGFVPRRTIDVIMFTSEEPTRFGIGCAGSRLLSSALQPEALATLTDEQGVTFDQARQRAGYTGALSDVPLRDDD